MWQHLVYIAARVPIAKRILCQQSKRVLPIELQQFAPQLLKQGTCTDLQTNLQTAMSTNFSIMRSKLGAGESGGKLPWECGIAAI